MGIFYHPFKENGNKANTFLENDNTIIFTGEDGQAIFPILNGTIEEIKNTEIVINTNTSGYSKNTEEIVVVKYSNLKVQEGLSKNDDVSIDTVLGYIKEKDSKCYLEITLTSKNNPIDISPLYQKNKDLVPKYEELQKNYLTIFNTNTLQAAGSNYARMIFAQKPKLTAFGGSYSASGIASIALNELCDMIRDPYPRTGYSKDSLGGVTANKYQSAASMGLNGHWCVAFVSYCANIGGFVSSGLYPGAKQTSCAVLQSSFRDIGNNPKPALDYSPVSGDLIFFNWAGSDASIDHIGIVYQITQKGIFTIEGNHTTTPEEFIDRVKQLNEINSGDPIVTTVKEITGELDDSAASKYRKYVAENYKQNGKTLYNEYNGVFLVYYPFSSTEIENYIHME